MGRVKKYYDALNNLLPLSQLKEYFDGATPNDTKIRNELANELNARRVKQAGQPSEVSDAEEVMDDDDDPNGSNLPTEFRRRLPETPSVSVQDPLTPALAGGSSTGLLVMFLLAVAFLVYWLVIRRFRRPVRKTARDYLRDLEAGRFEEDLSLLD